MEHGRTAIGISGLTARPPQRRRQAGSDSTRPQPASGAGCLPNKPSWHQALRGAASSSNNNSSGRPLERWGRAPVNWALDALHENEAAVAVRGLDPALPSSPHLAAFWRSSTLAAVWLLARLRWSLPEQAFLRSRDRAVGKRTQAYLALAPWVLNSPLSHQSFAAGRGSSLDASTRDSWLLGLPLTSRCTQEHVQRSTVQRSTVYLATPQLQQLDNLVADAVSVRQGCLLRAIPSFFRAKNGPSFFSDCLNPALWSPNSPKPCCVG